MPRRSVEALTTIPRVDGRPSRLTAPRHLSSAAAGIWREIVAALPAEHLRPSDEALMASYCEWTATARRAAAELATNGEVIDGKPSAWLIVAEKAQRAQAALAPKLRLCPSARTDPKTVARARGGFDADALLRELEGDADADSRC